MLNHRDIRIRVCDSQVVCHKASGLKKRVGKRWRCLTSKAWFAFRRVNKPPVIEVQPEEPPSKAAPPAYPMFHRPAAPSSAAVAVSGGGAGGGGFTKVNPGIIRALSGLISGCAKRGASGTWSLPGLIRKSSLQINGLGLDTRIRAWPRRDRGSGQDVGLSGRIRR